MENGVEKAIAGAVDCAAESEGPAIRERGKTTRNQVVGYANEDADLPRVDRVEPRGKALVLELGSEALVRRREQQFAGANVKRYVKK
jgi:hypothetical protein